ncbi:MAG: 5-bromo-4-chloroindolyl phosphate hydrolysis family protein [Oscillospiraceae bacterium]
MEPYNYGGETPKKNDNDWLSWAAILVLFGFGAWPIALIWLAVKLGGGEKKTTPPAPAVPLVKTPPSVQRTNAAKKVAKKMARPPKTSSASAKWLQVGGVLLALSGIFAGANVAGDIFQLGLNRALLWDLLSNAAWLLAGGAMLYSGRRMVGQTRRFPKYLAVLGDLPSMPLERFSRTLGYPEKTVIQDLEKMIDRGFFGGTAYLNRELGYFFRTAAAYDGVKQDTQPEKPAPAETETGYSGILRNLRRVNDRIADPVLSAKVERLGELAAKIFRVVEADPSKEGRISTFLNYYLPTTQKLLDAYAEFEATGIEGENLRQAKERIQATMDTIEAGFAHQLDELYRADVLDVNSDISVMEAMLERDIASAEKDFGLDCGTATQKE